jgi:hypothetical protein
MRKKEIEGREEDKLRVEETERVKRKARKKGKGTSSPARVLNMLWQ